MPPNWAPLEWAVAPSALGYLGVLQEGPRLVACLFGHPTELAAIGSLQQCWEKFLDPKTGQRAKHASWMGDLGVEADNRFSCKPLLERLVRYAEGEQDDFLDVPLLVSDRTSFQHRVIVACRAIPWGETRTYGELARVAGSPKSARAVGQVMATNRVPLVVPCHRVVAAGGRMGGFSAPQGVAMKRRLLELEGA